MQSVLSLTKEERRALVSLTRSRVSPAADVKRARLMIMLDDGLSWKSISKQLPCSPDYINRWRRRFDEDRLGGLYARHRGRAPAKNEAKLEARILAWTQNRPDDGSTHWSSRKLGKALGISHMMVARVWVKHGLRPHRLERYMASNDPKFEVRPPTLSGCISIRLPMRSFFVWTKRRRFRHLTALIQCCRCRPEGPNVTALSIAATVRSLCTRPLTLRTVACSAKPQRDTPAQSLWPFLPTSSPINPKAKRSTSFVIISQHTRLLGLNSSSRITPKFLSITRPLIPPGSTRSNCGLPKSSVMSLPAAFLLL